MQTTLRENFVVDVCAFGVCLPAVEGWIPIVPNMLAALMSHKILIVGEYVAHSIETPTRHAHPQSSFGRICTRLSRSSRFLNPESPAAPWGNSSRWLLPSRSSERLVSHEMESGRWVSLFCRRLRVFRAGSLPRLAGRWPSREFADTSNSSKSDSLCQEYRAVEVTTTVSKRVVQLQQA
jgi:hypothetical protein